MRMKFLIPLLTAVSLAVSSYAAQAGGANRNSEAVAESRVIDINSAGAGELKTLPGIGDAYAAKIIRYRPYRAKTDLVRRKILNGATYDKIKDRIIARQVK